jgi:hypothetical protein
MNQRQLGALRTRVQHNCHISDARHGADYAMCTFLMKMREYYRWEKGLPYGARLVKEEVGSWLAEREQLWEAVEEDEYGPLEIDGRRVDPFDAETANRILAPLGLVYSAGVGRSGKPHFFLGELQMAGHPGDYNVLISDRELARDLGAPPAMTRERTIYVRRESLRRMLWEQLESWRWNRPDNALGRAFACYDFEGDLEGSLDAMTDLEIEAALLHEMGEYQAGRFLGDEWETLLLELMGTPAELMARAVRDHLADCLVTLPALAEKGAAASLHFYLGNFTHMRQEIFPGLKAAYTQWQAEGRLEPIKAAAQRGRSHWRELALALLQTRAGAPETRPAAVERLVRGAYL